MTRLRHLLFLFVILLAAAAPARARGVDEILAAHRAASGETRTDGNVRLSYSYTGQGLSGEVRIRFDRATGYYLVENDLGLVRTASGYDGRTPWMRDFSGANTSQEGGDRVRLAVNEAYRYANLWWRADRGRARITFVGQEVADGRELDRLHVEPVGGTPFDAWFDRRTGLLARIAERQMFFNTRTFYEDYARRDGLMVPTRLVIDGGTGEANYATMRLTGLVQDDAGGPEIYARPTAAPTGVSIDGDRANATIPFRLLNNHIYVEVMVNGAGPYTFIVDTGGHTIISTRVAREAGLAATGAAASAGAGERITTSGYARVREIALGPVRMRDQVGIVMDIYDPAIEGIRVDGMVGFELFRRLAVRIDYGANNLTFTRFDAFDASDAGIPIPFKFYDHLPQVEGRVGDIPVLLDIDTGSRSEVDFTSPFVTEARLEERFPGGVTAMTGWGTGGPVMSQVVRVPSLSLGPVTVRSPVAALSRARAGSFSDANYGGNVGSGLLKRFVTSFDYSRQIMYLRPVAPPPADAGTFDRSGMWINAGEAGFAVTYVSPGGAADAAGIAAGDVITEIENRRPVAARLSEVRAALRMGRTGTRIPVTFVRGGVTRTVILVLRDRL